VTLTLDRVILHTIMHHSLTSTYTPNFIKIEETFCGQTDGRTFETGFIYRSTRRSRPNEGIYILNTSKNECIEHYVRIAFVILPIIIIIIIRT